ncbi:hypothetical protein CIPAW_09G027600 [Carya illinoinensis]|uniref:Uncharacterized protein n=1 Tax=Carya illinoinensis TaxID=32201 RepID=A0A8T1PGG1_CARIL|nr:hypothetical protein CIPAW_09G027600 [Carya illinoinensis]KAG6640785.1 hypothetical protein CIPAW_09G027600 [Carya illinoinensis]
MAPLHVNEGAVSSSGIPSIFRTREAYEEKLRSGNLYHDPTIYPGLGSPRCPRCLSLLNPNPEGKNRSSLPSCTMLLLLSVSSFLGLFDSRDPATSKSLERTKVASFHSRASSIATIFWC